MADALTVQGMNKVRASLGLPLLPVPGNTAVANKDSESSGSESDDPASTLETRAAEGYENWNQLQKQAAEKKKRQARLDAIKKSRDEAQRKSKLTGQGLGDADSDEDLSARAWLKGAAKRQKNIEKEREKARKIEQELREREERAYTSKDLAGLKVAHQAGEFELEDGEQILTLKDATIEENEEEGDELENVQLVEKAKLEERLSLKRKKHGYNPMDDIEGDKKILQQYDEVIDGKKRKAFTLNDEGEVDQDEEMVEADGPSRAKIAISLDMLKDLPSSDYQEPTEIKMKKIKKKKVKNARQREQDDDIIIPASNGTTNGNSMDTGSAERPAKRQKDTPFDDDEDLQLSLARQRRAALKQRKRARPEDLAEQIRQEESEIPDVKMEEAEDAGFVIDEASEFISNLQLPEPEQPRTINKKAAVKKEESGSDDEDVDMTRSYNDIPDVEAKEETVTTGDVDETGLGTEVTVNSGIAAALSLARDRGLVTAAKEGESNEDTRRRNLFMNEKLKIERDLDDWARRERERLRNSAEWKRLPIREQENRSARLNEERDRRKGDMLSQLMEKQYRPAVQLKYVDEHGRNMNQKEAFKTMSHAFHGKGSGKQKTERHLKKIEDEKQREAKSVLDSAAGSANSAASAAAKRNKHPGVRIA